MKNTCPQCNTAYAVNAAAIGRTFTCKKCRSALVVNDDGLALKDGAPAGQSDDVEKREKVAAAEKSDRRPDREDDDDRPAKKKRDDEDDEDRPRKKKRDDEDDEDRPRKKKRDDDEDDEDRPRKKKRRDDEDDEDRPRRSGRRRQTEEGGFGDVLAFRKFLIPGIIPIAFWFITAAILVFGGYLTYMILDSGVATLAGVMLLLLVLPASLLANRLLCEVAMIAWRTYEKANAPKETIVVPPPKVEE